MTAEKTLYNPDTSAGARIIATVGYAGGSEVPVFNKTYSTDGTGTWVTFPPAPGDCAALIRYSTPSRSSKNHPIYCFNYYHAAAGTNVVTTPDTLNSTQRSNMSTYAASWLTGFSDGTTNHIRSRPDATACTGSLVEPFLTHRDLPR